MKNVASKVPRSILMAEVIAMVIESIFIVPCGQDDRKFCLAHSLELSFLWDGLSFLAYKFCHIS